MSQPKPEGPDNNERGAGFGLLDCTLMAALSRDIRIAILSTLVERAASPKELAEVVGYSLSTVSYHTERLLEADLIFLESTATRRGAVEHFYRAKWPTILPPGVWDGFPGGLQPAVGVRILQQFFIEARQAFEAKTVTEDPSEVCLTPLRLDRTGEEEMLELTRQYLDGLLNLQSNASGRAREKGDGGDRRMKSYRVMLSSFAVCQDSELRWKAGERLRM